MWMCRAPGARRAWSWRSCTRMQWTSPKQGESWTCRGALRPRATRTSWTASTSKLSVNRHKVSSCVTAPVATQVFHIAIFSAGRSPALHAACGLPLDSDSSVNTPEQCAHSVMPRCSASSSVLTLTSPVAQRAACITVSPAVASAQGALSIQHGHWPAVPGGGGAQAPGALRPL